MAHNTESALASQAKNDLESSRPNPTRKGSHGGTEAPGLAFCFGGSPLIAFLCGCGSAGQILQALHGQGVCPGGRPPGCPLVALQGASGLPPVSNTGASPVESSEAATIPTDTPDAR